MSEDKNSGRSTGISTLGVLGVVFVTLKLLGKIGWSWWWVTAPFWGMFAICVLFFAVVLLMAVVAAALGVK